MRAADIYTRRKRRRVLSSCNKNSACRRAIKIPLDLSFRKKYNIFVEMGGNCPDFQSLSKIFKKNLKNTEKRLTNRQKHSIIIKYN